MPQPMNVSKGARTNDMEPTIFIHLMAFGKELFCLLSTCLLYFHKGGN